MGGERRGEGSGVIGGEIVALLAGSRLLDAISISDRKGESLILVLQSGDAVEISGTGLTARFVPDYEASLQAIEIRVVPPPP